MDLDAILRMKAISKAFPGVIALSDVSFDLRKGETHALIGENGAGKSTLMKILGGAYTPDGGEIEIQGQTVSISSPAVALALGVSVIYQEFNLVPTLNVVENIFLGKEMSRGPFGVMDRSAMRTKARSVLEQLGLDNVDLKTQVRGLSVAQQQLVEIGKALFNDASILVMDEPTSVLSAKESDRLFHLMGELIGRGISIVYVSHRLEEVLRLADRITVLRDGARICTLDNGPKAVSKDELIRYMVGRDLVDYFPRRAVRPGTEKVLEVKNLSRRGEFENISFDLHRSEILGVYGLVGAGRTEIAETIFGHRRADFGEVSVVGKPMNSADIIDSIREGIALVPEDRKRGGLVTVLSLGDNICLPNQKRIATLGTVVARKKKRLVNEYMESLSIRPALPTRPVREFSGGNQQKAVIAKWLATRPKVIIFDEPTRGIDVGAKAEIYQLITNLSEQGVGILFISSELLEILGMCDRVVVVYDGRISGHFTKTEATQERLMHAAAGYETQLNTRPGVVSCDSE